MSHDLLSQLDARVVRFSTIDKSWLAALWVRCACMHVAVWVICIFSCGLNSGDNLRVSIYRGGGGLH